MKTAALFGILTGFTSVITWEYYNAPKVVYIEKEVVPDTLNFLVVDSNYIDHSGDYKSCVEYKEYFKDHHDYVVVAQQEIK